MLQFRGPATIIQNQKPRAAMFYWRAAWMSVSSACMLVGSVNAESIYTHGNSN